MARIDDKTHVPVLAIVMQSVLTLVIALSGSYEKILNYVVSIDFIFFGLTGASLFVFRRRDADGGRVSRAGASVDDRDFRGFAGWWSGTRFTGIRRIRCWGWGFWRWACRCIGSGRGEREWLVASGMVARDDTRVPRILSPRTSTDHAE